MTDKLVKASAAFERLRQAEQFVAMQPLFYDTAGIWWMWNADEYYYERVDDVDILNGISKNMSLDTTRNKIKSEILNALKQVGRRKFREKKETKKSWVQFKDKIVDVKTSKQFKATSEYFVTCPIPWRIGETEKTPTMDKLFREWVVMERVQDESYTKTLYETIAYSTLEDQFLQRLFALQGVGSNGKGCFLKIVKKFIGAQNTCTTDFKMLSNNNFASASLYKKQVCFITEIDDTDMRNTKLLKKLTGEDDIRYEFKGKNAISATSGTTCFIGTNQLPITPDKSPGFHRRWLIIDFPHIFPTGKDVVGEIPEIEFSNLALKCIRICKELYEHKKFTNEGDIEERTRRYEERSNPLLRFVAEKAIENPEKHTVFSKFCKYFNLYLTENRLRLMTKRKISKLLRDEGFLVKGRRTYDEEQGEIQTTCVWGLSLEEIEDYDF